MKSLRTYGVCSNIRFTARQALIAGIIVLLLTTACSGSAERDQTQPLFWTPEAMPTPQERADALSHPPAGSSGRTATATPEPSLGSTFTPTGTPTPTATREPSANPTVAPSDTPTPTPSATATEVTNPTATPTATVRPTDTATPTDTPSSTATPTRVASSTPRPTPTETPRPRATAVPTDTPSPNSATLRGRILLNGTPPEGMVTLTLEDQTYRVV